MDPFAGQFNMGGMEFMGDVKSNLYSWTLPDVNAAHVDAAADVADSAVGYYRGESSGVQIEEPEDSSSREQDSSSS